MLSFEDYGSLDLCENNSVKLSNTGLRDTPWVVNGVGPGLGRETDCAA